MENEDIILKKVKELIKDKVDTKSIRRILSEEFEVPESKIASYIKKVRKQLGLYKPNSGNVNIYNDDEDNLSDFNFKKESSKYNYKTFNRYN